MSKKMMFPALFISFFLCNLSSAELVKEHKESRVTELIRTALLNPDDLDFIIHEVVENSTNQNGNEIIGAEELAVSIRNFVLSESFLKEFLPYFEEFSNEEIDQLLDFYKSETMEKFNRKSRICNKKLFNRIFSMFEDPLFQSTIDLR